jgi:hypothetical protein
MTLGPILQTVAKYNKKQEQNYTLYSNNHPVRHSSTMQIHENIILAKHTLQWQKPQQQQESIHNNNERRTYETLGGV